MAALVSRFWELLKHTCALTLMAADAFSVNWGVGGNTVQLFYLSIGV